MSDDGSPRSDRRFNGDRDEDAEMTGGSPPAAADRKRSPDGRDKDQDRERSKSRSPAPRRNRSGSRSRSRSRSRGGRRGDKERERKSSREPRERGGRGDRDRDRGDPALSRDAAANGRTSIYVRGLHDATRPEDLREVFEKYGEIKDVYIPRDFYSRRAKGYAYIEFGNPEEAEQAMSRIEALTLNDARLTLEWAKGNRKNSREMRDREGYRGGGYGGGGGYGRRPPYDKYGPPRGYGGYDRRDSRDHGRRRSRSRSPRRDRDRSRDRSRDRRR